MSRRFVRTIPFALLLAVAAGCTVQQADVERSIRTEMKAQMNVDIATFQLKKQPDGSYAGTAATATGDSYDVVSTVKDNKIDWQAIPGQTLVDKTLREGIEKQLKTKVKALQLTRIGAGAYTGQAELDNGAHMNVSTHMEGTQLLWEGKEVK